MHHDAVGTLLLDQRLGHAQLIDALGEGGDILFHAFVDGRLQGGRLQGDVQFQIAAFARIGERQLSHLVGQDILCLQARFRVTEVDLHAVAHALDAGVADILVAQHATRGGLDALDFLIQYCFRIDLHQEVHATAQVQTQEHGQGMQFLHPHWRIGLQIDRHDVRGIGGIGVQVLLQHQFCLELGIGIGETHAHGGEVAGAIHGDTFRLDVLFRQYLLDLRHQLARHFDSRLAAGYLQRR